MNDINKMTMNTLIFLKSAFLQGSYRSLNLAKIPNPGGGGALPYETDGDARRLA